jgi:hypothetical protein
MLPLQQRVALYTPRILQPCSSPTTDAPPALGSGRREIDAGTETGDAQKEREEREKKEGEKEEEERERREREREGERGGGERREGRKKQGEKGEREKGEVLTYLQ